MLLLLGFLFVTVLKAQSNPTDLVCDNVVIQPSQWASKFATSYGFTGFFRADGSIRFHLPDYTVLFTINLNNSVWHQYFSPAGYMIGDLHLSAAAFGMPGITVLTSRQVSNPMFAGSAICQKFLAPSPQELIDSYSELVAHGKGYMESKYFSLDAATFKEVTHNEFFRFDPGSANTAFSMTNTFSVGPLGFVSQSVNFRYTRITQEEATALGWSANPATVPASSRGLRLGRGACPVTLLSAEQRQQVGL